MGNAFAGGVSYHYMESGPELEVRQCYTSLTDFAKAVSTPQNSAETTESKKAF